MIRSSLAAAAALFAISAQAQEVPPELAGGDPAAGERAFRVCMACHAVGEGAKNRVGPQLNDVFGRKPGGVEDFKYSPAMTEFGAQQPVWHAALLADFLRNPRETMPGTKMAFPGVRDEEDLKNLLAYLAQFDEGGMAAE